MYNTLQKLQLTNGGGQRDNQMIALILLFAFKFTQIKLESYLVYLLYLNQLTKKT